MKHIRYNLVFIFSLLISVNSFSQSKKQWIEEGDKCFKAQDYSTAIAWYVKALDDTSIVKSVAVLPYDVSLVNKKFKNSNNLVKQKKDTLSTAKKDSLGLVKKDSTQVVKKDNSVSTPKKIVPRDTGSVKLTGKKSKKDDLKKTSPEIYVNLKLAHSYRLNADYTNAANHYQFCVDNNVMDSKFYYGLTLMNLKRYQDALNTFESYVNANEGTDSLLMIAQKKQSGCYLAIDSLAGNIRTMKVALLDTTVFNKGNSSFATSFYNNAPNKILFTSARKGNIVLDPKKTDPEFVCDLYWTERGDTAWSVPTNMGPPLNSELHEGAAVINERACYFTRWSDVNPSEASIYRVNMQDGRSFAPQKLGPSINRIGFKSTHPFLTGDGKKLFFSSNMPGGKGGMDIWVCDISEDGMLGEAKNIGPPINTAGDETTPFLHAASNTFYFSSNGLIGLGGLDVFKAEYNAFDNVFGIPANLNLPINSSKDDAYFIMENNGLRGFFTSDRADCPGGNCFKIYQFTNEPVTFDITGVVFDATTNEPIVEALVTIKNVHNEEETFFIVTDKSGGYFQELKANTEYFVKAQKNKYFADAVSVVTEGKLVSEHFEKDLFMNTIPAGEIEISGIEYDFNSATLREVSMQSLDKIVDLLKLNDNLSVDIEANTDSRGNDNYNLKLSQARAQSCVDYLVSKGIATTRLRSKGFGETNPLIKEADINKLTAKSPEWEAAHQKNRRTALRIVGETEIKIINKGK